MVNVFVATSPFRFVRFVVYLLKALSLSDLRSTFGRRTRASCVCNFHERRARCIERTQPGIKARVSALFRLRTAVLRQVRDSSSGNQSFFLPRGDNRGNVRSIVA